MLGSSSHDKVRESSFPPHRRTLAKFDINDQDVVANNIHAKKTIPTPSFNNISIYEHAKNMDCNRTWLQKVISGDRNIDFENFIKLGRELLKHIDENSYLELYEIFAENYF